MSRVTVELPETFLFRCELEVRAADLNYGGHVGNDSILTLMQEARIMFYRHLGVTELKLEGQIGQIVADAAVVYKSESFLGDVLIIEVAARDFTKVGFDLLYQITNKATGKEVARGKTGMVCFDYEKRKIAPIPPGFLRTLTHLS